MIYKKYTHFHMIGCFGATLPRRSPLGSTKRQRAFATKLVVAASR